MTKNRKKPARLLGEFYGDLGKALDEAIRTKKPFKFSEMKPSKAFQKLMLWQARQ